MKLSDISQPDGAGKKLNEALIGDKRTPGNVMVMKSMLMAKLFKDGFITKGEDGVYHVDMRVSELKKAYGDRGETISDIRKVLNQLVAGLRKTRYKVEVTFIDME
jgi:predicted RNA-binding protein YlqC (UPF0109 family)